MGYGRFTSDNIKLGDRYFFLTGDRKQLNIADVVNVNEDGFHYENGKEKIGYQRFDQEICGVIMSKEVVNERNRFTKMYIGGAFLDSPYGQRLAPQFEMQLTKKPKPKDLPVAKEIDIPPDIDWR